MNKQLLFLALIIMNSIAITAMELTSSQPKRTVPTLKTITEKYLIDHKDKDTHPCTHMDTLLAQSICEDMHNDLKKQFLTKYALYGICNSTKIHDQCVEKSVVSNNGDSVFFIVNKSILELDTASNTIISKIKGHEKCINDLIKHKNILISGSWDQTIKLWNPNSYECLQTFNDEDNIVCLASENTDIICSASKNHIKIWDITSSKCLNERYGELRDNNECILNNGILYIPNNYYKLVQWDLRTKSPIVYKKIKPSAGMAFHSSISTTLFAGKYEGGVKQWDMRNTNEPVQTYPTIAAVSTIKIHNNLLFIALSAPFSFGGGQGLKFHKHPGIEVWNLKNNKRIGILPGPDHEEIFNLNTHDSGLYISSSEKLMKYTSISYDNTYEALQDIDFTMTKNNNSLYSKDIQSDIQGNNGCVIN